jgi:hypothetical protein
MLLDPWGKPVLTDQASKTLPPAPFAAIARRLGEVCACALCC